MSFSCSNCESCSQVVEKMIVLCGLFYFFHSVVPNILTVCIKDGIEEKSDLLLRGYTIFVWFCFLVLFTTTCCMC